MGYTCSTWEGGETQKGGEDKESIKDRLPATLGRVDYVGKGFNKQTEKWQECLVMIDR